MVKMYSNEGCSRCMVLRKKMQMKNIPYEETHDLSEIKDMGFKQLPVIVIDDKYVTFKEANDWIQNYK